MQPFSSNLVEDSKRRVKLAVLQIRVQDVTLGILCCLVIYLLRFRETYQLQPTWHMDIDLSGFQNNRYVTKPERLLAPIVTDLNSDGINEVVIVTTQMQLQILVVPQVADEKLARLPQPIVKQIRSLNNLEHPDGKPSYPVAIEAGFIEKVNSTRKRSQVIVIVFDNWEVQCYDSNLNLLWERVLMKDVQPRDMYSVKSMGILITSTTLEKEDEGVVIIGGSLEHFGHNTRQRPLGTGPRPPMAHAGGRRMQETQDTDPVLHFSTFALNGGTGEVRWHHLPGDFQQIKVHEPREYHWKLSLHRSSFHAGESPWTSYGANMLKHMPHHWSWISDTKFDIAHLSKLGSSAGEGDGEGEGVTPTSQTILQDILGLEEDHIAGKAYGGMRPHSRHEHVKHPNAVVIHSHHGIEVLNLQTGRPMTRLHVPTQKAAYGDVNANGMVERVSTNMKGTCQGDVNTVLPNPRKLFTASICSAPSFWSPVSLMVATANHDSPHTEEQKSVLPVLVKSVGKRRGMVNHLMGKSLASERRGMDSIFISSTGRVSSYGPTGDLNWQVFSSTRWSDQSQMQANGMRFHYQDIFREAFMPSLTPFSLQIFGKENALLILGWNSLSVLDSYDGYELGTHSLPREPVLPPVIADFNGDGLNDVIVTTSKHYVGFAVEKQVNWLHTGVLGVVVILFMLLMSWCCQPPDHDEETIDYAVD